MTKLYYIVTRSNRIFSIGSDFRAQRDIADAVKDSHLATLIMTPEDFEDFFEAVTCIGGGFDER